MCFSRCFCIKNIEKDDTDEDNHPLRQRQVSKQSQRTTVEDLPNELIFMLFDYLYFYDIINAFDQLNNRLQLLLYAYNSYHLNFNRFLTKRQFKLMKGLPLNPQHVKSLILSNNYFSFTNIQECLLKYPIKLFYSRLQSLSLMHCNDDQLLLIVLLTSNFQQLKYLSIAYESDAFLSLPDDRMTRIRTQILFEIKTLKYFNWHSREDFFREISETVLNRKSSIEYYEFSEILTDEILWLYFHSLNMKSIHIHKTSFDFLFDQRTSYETLTKLKIDKFKTEQRSQYFLENLSFFTRLKYLQLECDRFYTQHEEKLVQGYTWENFIRTYMPQLEIFKFFFAAYVTHIDPKLFIKGFMTDFWLAEKKWYVTCDCDTTAWFLYVYTVPCSVEKFTYDEKLFHRESTAIVNDMSNVRHFILPRISKLIASTDRFTNIQSLKIDSLPSDVNYDRLNRLIHSSSIQTIEFGAEIDSEIFFNILKFINREMSIDICYINLMNMLRNRNLHTDDGIDIQFKQVEQLTMSKSELLKLEEKDIIYICYTFPNIKRLIMDGFDSGQLIPMLLCHLKKISFLSMSMWSITSLFQGMSISAFQQWIIRQSRGKLRRNNFHCEISESEFRLIID